VRDQLKARTAALEPRKSESGVADLIKASESAIKRTDVLEDKLHNPTAEVVYDILAMRGGTRLYSRLSPLQLWAVEATGAPTTGMTQVLTEQEQELASLESETKAFLSTDVASLNQRATAVSVPYVVLKDR
jgi:hypothetical protein